MAPLKELILMSGYLTHTLHPTDTPTLNSLPQARANKEKGLRTKNSRHRTGILFPLVLSATGGLAREATTFYKRLASMLASKWDQSYSSTLCWLRCRLTFSLLRSSIQAIRGSRSSSGHPFRSGAIDLVISETHLHQ